MRRNWLQVLSILVTLIAVVAVGAEQHARPVKAAPAAVTPAVKSPLEPVAHTEPSSIVRREWMETSAYCPCTRCCGAHASGITASGLPVTHNDGRFVAADTRVLPMGSHLSIPGYHEGHVVPVIDRGGAIKGNRIDLFFPTHEEALQWGRRWVLVDVMADSAR